MEAAFGITELIILPRQVSHGRRFERGGVLWKLSYETDLNSRENVNHIPDGDSRWTALSALNRNDISRHGVGWLR